MSGDALDHVHLPAEVEVQLDRRLAGWANARRLGAGDLAAIRARVLARASEPVAEPAVQPVAQPLAEPVAGPVAEPVADLDAEPAFDAEWLWSLLRPVTALVERTVEIGPSNLSDRVERWMGPLTGDRAYRPYLQLA